MFAVLAEQILNDPQNLVVGMKEKTVIIHPETVTFKILKLLPTSISKNLLVKEE